MSPTINEIKALNGKILAMLTEREQQVLDFFRERGRKFGVSVSIINMANPEEVAQARSKEQADEIMKKANSRIQVSSIAFEEPVEHVIDSVSISVHDMTRRGGTSSGEE